MNIQLYKNHILCEDVDGPAKALEAKDFRCGSLWSAERLGGRSRARREMSTATPQDMQGRLWKHGRAGRRRARCAPAGVRTGGRAGGTSR